MKKKVFKKFKPLKESNEKPHIIDEEEDIIESEEMDMDEEETEKPKKKEKKKFGVVALKHKMVLDNLKKNVGKGGKNSIKKAMIDAGYSENYADNGNIKKSKTWEQLMEQYLPDDLLSKTHSDLLKASKLDYMLFSSEIKDEEIYELVESVGCICKKIIHGMQGTHVYYFAPDNRSRKDATELAYKIKGKMSAEKLEVETKGLRAMSDAELAEVISKQKKFFTKKD